MAISVPVSANTLFAEATVAADGTLHLEGAAPTLKPGDRVMLTISPALDAPSGSGGTPLRGSVLRYDEPFGAAARAEDWEALR